MNSEPSGRRAATPVIASSSVAFVLTLAALVEAPGRAAAERDIRNLMTMDHHLVQSDFIGVIRISEVALEPERASGRSSAESEAGYTRRVDATVEDVWSTRWSTAPGDPLTFNTSTRVRYFEAGGRYLVLLLGGGPRDSPLAHGGNSVFRIGGEGAPLQCHDGTTLYAALTTGFLCSVPALVHGAPASLSQLRPKLLLRLERARRRLSSLAAARDREARVLETVPRDAAGTAVGP